MRHAEGECAHKSSSCSRRKESLSTTSVGSGAALADCHVLFQRALLLYTHLRSCCRLVRGAHRLHALGCFSVWGGYGRYVVDIGTLIFCRRERFLARSFFRTSRRVKYSYSVLRYPSEPRNASKSTSDRWRIVRIASELHFSSRCRSETSLITSKYEDCFILLHDTLKSQPTQALYLTSLPCALRLLDTT